jgi:hypothetical protein
MNVPLKMIESKGAAEANVVLDETESGTPCW